MIRIRLFSVLMAISLLCSYEVLAQNRVALVIGNSSYEGKLYLDNPKNDANDITSKLKNLDFKVIRLIDGNKRQMVNALRKFKNTAEKGGVALFYYAGHAIQMNGKNYLIPLGSSIETPEDIEFESLNASRVLNTIDSMKQTINVVILDACRNNPFDKKRAFRSYLRSVGSEGRGLAEIRGIRGSLIAFATQPGNTAADGDGRNGTYTQQLLKYLDQPNLTLPQMFNKVGLGVLKATNNVQEPWLHASPVPDFYMVAGGSIIEKRSVTVKGKEGKTPSLLGKVLIKTQPNDAKIYLNNGYVGRGSEVLTLKTGSYNLKAKKKGYNETSEDVYVSIGKELKVTLILTKPSDDNYPTEYEFRVYRTPSDAKVRILNINPTYYDGMRLKSGDYHIEVSKLGYNKVKQWVTIGEGDKTVTVRLKKPQSSPSTGDSTYQTVHVSGGCFQMGGTKYDSEKPIHKVCLDDFRMGKYEVTVGQFKKFVNATGYQGDGKNGWKCKGGMMKPEGFTQANNHPVACISWKEATAYAKWLSRKTGQNYSLPTEAEWEYA
ncbi:MAG: SUMF1/EgtB/PvdO family nonheme iron enzyme, partial [Methylococcales bacterium]|nr:SUMF1/EgtB/PvdO family nonheme iron enzyme [Methylococcales bacterium]